MRKKRSTEERFWARVQKADGCWLWIGGRSPLGYGRLTLFRPRRYEGAHRLSWEIHYGAIPRGMCVCHRCDVRACVRPDHLFLGTISENILDCVSKGRGAKGERQHCAKLTADKVFDIRAEYAAGGVSQSALGRKHGVAQSVIGDIIRRVSWKHIA